MASTNNLDFLGRGWGWNFSFTSRTGGVYEGINPNDDGGLDRLTASIQQILGTNVGTRVMRRDFGSSAFSFVFSPNDPQIDVKLDYAIRQALAKWEPRVTVGQITISHERKNDGILDVTLQVTINKTNTTLNIVWPFFLSTAEQQTFPVTSRSQ
jgi:hypothetical protein